ncbi:MAG: hypothetical protein AAGM67_16740, partial [Bacteroidota bacterium]
MKRISILFFLCAFAISLSAQTQPRNKVVIEVFTGTWCQFCPGWALATDEYKANGDDVAVVKYHIGDNYSTNSSQSRDGYYGASGYPTHVFDGTDQSGGGSQTQSQYSSSYNRYQSAISVGSPIDMELFWEYDSINLAINAFVVVEQVASLSAGTPVLHFAVTESKIADSWFGLSEVNSVERMMLPNASGTTLPNLQIGVKDTLSFSFPIGSMVKENLEAVAFLQDPSSRTIYNGVSESLEGPTSTYDVIALNFQQEIPTKLCLDDVIEPEVTFENNGAAILTSLDISYSVNGEPAQTYTWTGSLDYGQEATVTLPALSFAQQQSGNQLSI